MKKHFGVDLPPEYPQEAYPNFPAPVVMRSHKTGRTGIGLARFGLIPAWAKDSKISRHTYNARAETVARKPSYRTAWRNRHFCLVLVDNFYEPCYETGKAVRWRIQTKNKHPFGIAGIWDRWIEPKTGNSIVSFSMLTINADDHPVMNQFHKAGDEKRTPVIISPEQYSQWLVAETEEAHLFLNLEQMPPITAESASIF